MWYEKRLGAYNDMHHFPGSKSLTLKEVLSYQVLKWIITMGYIDPQQLPSVEMEEPRNRYTYYALK